MQSQIGGFGRIATFLAILAIAGASASANTITFSGTIGLGNATIPAGTPFSGSFNYSPTAPYGSDLTLEVGAYTFNFTRGPAAPGIEAFDAPPGQDDFISFAGSNVLQPPSCCSTNYPGSFDTISVGIMLWGNSNLVSSSDVPQSFDPANVFLLSNPNAPGNVANIRIELSTAIRTSFVDLRGSVTELAITTVPEPNPRGLILAGLITILGFAVRRPRRVSWV
jgi:hypothetical protein